MNQKHEVKYNIRFLSGFTILFILSKQFWCLKYKGLTPEIEWSILKKSNTPNSFDGRCNLCLKEKIHILTHKFPDKLLNKRNELIARCRYKTKFKL